MRLLHAFTAALGATALSGCTSLGIAMLAMPQQPTYTAQPVENIARLTAGMSKQDVSQIMGNPARTEFSGTAEAWHFCRTGASADEFAVVLFSNGRVTGARNYNVTLADTGGATGDCSKFVKSVLR